MGKIILEIGAGATGVCGLVCAKLRARKVWMTDHPNLEIVSLQALCGLNRSVIRFQVSLSLRFS